MIPVLVGPDDLVSALMPTSAERRALGILGPDVPVLSVKREARLKNCSMRA